MRITRKSKIIAPKPQQIASRNDMLKISNSRRRFMANPPKAPSSSRRADHEEPISRRRLRVAFHREQQRVDGHTDGQLPNRPIEVVETLTGLDAGRVGMTSPIVGKPSTSK